MENWLLDGRAKIDLLKNPPDNMSPEDRWFLDGTVVHKTVDLKVVAPIDLLKNPMSPDDRWPLIQ